MAAPVSHLPAFLSLLSHKLFFSDPHQQSTLGFTALQRCPPPPRCTLRASSLRKKTRKVKSNADLCNDLRQFLTAAGLSECHVPSLKELSQHGRNDLANIVRRRGYKLIRELLVDSINTDTNGNADTGFAGIQDSIDDRKEIVTDNVYGILTENKDEEIKEEYRFGNTEEVQIRIPKNVLDRSDAINQRTSTTTTAVDPSLSREDSSSTEGLSSLYDKDLADKTSESEDQLELNHLKFMLHQKEMELLHQKEMELSRLKEQIEKEELFLLNLQTKSEMAMSKAQKLVSEKDAELLADEESLSGLVEVEIQYQGDGEIVEVTGSFNGWYHQIEMDPQPSSSIIERNISGIMSLPIARTTRSCREPRLWSTMLWLYPGTYEIKFIVDGQWMIDPQRESVTRGTICNNILHVNG